jgi:hypothetical protein
MGDIFGAEDSAQILLSGVPVNVFRKVKPKVSHSTKNENPITMNEVKAALIHCWSNGEITGIHLILRNADSPCATISVVHKL